MSAPAAGTMDAGTAPALVLASVVPVSVITGFLGSGKTTLLRTLLRDPALGRTVVIINEFGEIGIDHDLIEQSDEDFIALTTGCLCCKVRSDLVMTLQDLAARRADGRLPPFEQVLIETSGLADPAAILQALMVDRDLAGLYALGQVLATVDSLLGMDTLDEHLQSVRQVAVADQVLFTKTDLPAVSLTALDALEARVAAINPGAVRRRIQKGAIGALELLGSARGAREPGTGLGRLAADPFDAVIRYRHAAVHDPRIASYALVRQQPIRAVTLALFLEALAEHCGERLLRMKGIVHVAEMPDRPAVIHGVQHVFHPPVWLDRWPSRDRRSRIVFIGRDIPVRWIDALLDVLEAEVAVEQKAIQAQPDPAVVPGAGGALS